MKVALVASSYLPRPGGLERHVDELARGLSHRGVEVEVLAQQAPRGLPPVSEFDSFVVRRFAASIGNAHFVVAPSLWEHLRRTATSFDVLHVHSRHAPLALAVAHVHPRRFVYTPHTPVLHLLHWPYARMTQVLLDHGAQIICAAAVERELIRRKFPQAVNRIGFVAQGLDVAGIEAARPFVFPGTVVLAVGRLARRKRIDRAIAAMAALDRTFRLAVVGEGPARQKLLAHAADLQVSARVKIVGSVPDEELYRWLRTAGVVVALSEEDSSGLQVTEALAAGAPVVASDIPVHREAASNAGDVGVKFVSEAGSPLEIADAICGAAGLSIPESVRAALPTWDGVVERTLAVYTAAIRGKSPMAVARA